MNNSKKYEEKQHVNLRRVGLEGEPFSVIWGDLSRVMLAGSLDREVEDIGGQKIRGAMRFLSCEWFLTQSSCPSLFKDISLECLLHRGLGLIGNSLSLPL